MMEIKVDGKTYWMDEVASAQMQKFYDAREELVSLLWMFGHVPTEADTERIYAKHGVPYIKPDPFALDYYYIITDIGLMARDRKGGGDYLVGDGYGIEKEPYTGSYTYLRDASGMDL